MVLVNNGVHMNWHKPAIVVPSNSGTCNAHAQTKDGKVGGVLMHTLCSANSVGIAMTRFEVWQTI